MALSRRGSGRVYQPKGGSIWWAELWVNGVQHRETTGTRNKREAISFLDHRKAEIMQGIFNPDASKVTIAELMTDYMALARVNGMKSYVDIEGRWRLHLKPVLGQLKAAQLTTTLINSHIEKRLRAGAKPATVNRELEILKRAYNLGAQHEPPKVMRVPLFSHLKENNVRKGFLELAEYQRLLQGCTAVGPWLRGVFETGYTFGWRAEEVTNLRANQVDMLNRCIRLNPGETKNNDGRIAYMTTDLYNALVPLMFGKSGDDYVFTRPDSSHLVDFRKAWWKVCVAAGLGTMICRKCEATSNSPSNCGSCHSNNIGYRGLLFHDLRRTAIRNMVRRGVPEKWAMAISGHKTRSVFDRYNIVSDGDLREAARRNEAGLKAELAELFNDQAAKHESEFPHKTRIVAPEKAGLQNPRLSIRCLISEG